MNYHAGHRLVLVNRSLRIEATANLQAPIPIGASLAALIEPPYRRRAVEAARAAILRGEITEACYRVSRAPEICWRVTVFPLRIRSQTHALFVAHPVPEKQYCSPDPKQCFCRAQ